MGSAVVLDVSSFEQWRSGSITGRVCLRFGDRFFPELDWSDFPVVVLEWWLGSFKASAPVLRFMDGPFRVVLDPAAGTACLMREETLVDGVEVDEAGLCRSVRKAARSALRRGEELGMVSDDVEAFRRRLAVPSS
jgi:hypothetical protein